MLGMVKYFKNGGGTTMGKYKIFLFEDMHEEGKSILREKADIFFAEKYDEDYLIGQVKDVDGIIIRANGKVTRKLMEAAPRLKVVGRHGVGVENIDIQAATERGVWVVYTPDANTTSVAEHFFGLAIMLSKMLRKGERAFREEGRWEARYQYIGNELHGKTLGILGFGRIGKATGRIGHHGFDMKILYHDAFRFEEMEKEIGAVKVSLDELLSQSDFISVNLPMLPETQGVLGAREFGLMKKTAYVINVARGPIWDEKALSSALKEGKIAGAGSDVYEVEPSSKDHHLLQFENFIGTPHMAAHTQEALKRMSRVAVDILRVLDGKEPSYPVNRPGRSNR
jgi:D-3-phosphoglycerate dehydrogenase / 2-oxoglutarate reductase